MLQAIPTAYETFLTLKRDRIYYPALIITALIFVAASFIAEWSVDDWRIIFFNFSQTMFRISGDIIAILFGTKLLQDAVTDGSIETSLSRPVGRAEWVLGKFLGLSCALLLFALITGSFWLFINYFFEMDMPKDFIYWGIGLAFCEWLVVGAIAIFFSTIGGFGSSLFATSMVWILGMLSGAIAASFDNESNLGYDFVAVVNYLSKFLNFDRFTIIHYTQDFSLPSQSFLLGNLGYALCLCVFLLALSGITIKLQDVTR